MDKVTVTATDKANAIRANAKERAAKIVARADKRAVKVATATGTTGGAKMVTQPIAAAAPEIQAAITAYLANGAKNGETVVGTVSEKVYRSVRVPCKLANGDLVTRWVWL